MTTTTQPELTQIIHAGHATLRIYELPHGRLVQEQDRHGSTWIAVAGGYRSRAFPSAEKAREWLG